MSHIPNSAMPHAGDIHVDGGQDETMNRSEGGTSLRERAGKLADQAREKPAIAAAAGAAVLGVAAAAALPLMRGWGSGKSSSSSKGRSRNSKKSS